MAVRTENDGPASSTPDRRRVRMASPLKTLALVAVCLLTVVAGAVAYGRFATSGHGDDDRAAHRRSAVKLTGQVEHLYPGQPSTLELLAVNRTRRPLVLTKVKARTMPAGLGCPASALSISPARPRAPLAPHGSTTVKLRAVISGSATSACSGATWPLRFKAHAVTTRRAK